MSFNAPDINQFKVIGSTVGDVYFPQTEMLLPFNGANGATATDDLSNLNNAVTFGGNASISTARSKFGGSSCHFDGTGDYVDVGGTYWTTGSAIDSGDFTIDFWLNVDAWGGNDVQSLFSNYGTNSAGWALYLSTSTNKLYWWFHNGSAWVYLNYNTGTRTALSLDTWYHIALTRSGNIFRLFLDGTQEDSVTDSNAMTSSNGGVHSGIRIGAVNAGLDYPVNGYIDDFRITKGVARYTSNFTAPTTAHSTSAGDANKQIIVNSAADGVAVGTGGINQARIAKAWVNFNGSGTVAIRDSYNVSSITDNATGRWRVNFSTNLANADFSVSAALGTVTGSNLATSALIHCGNDTEYAPSTSGFTLSAVYPSVSWQDAKYLSAQVFGN